MNLQPNTTRSLLITVLILIVMNAVFFIGGLWQSLWWLGLLVNFVLIVAVASRISEYVPMSYQKTYERLLAVGFPVLILICWELLVGAEILSARWFPPPSKIVEALWELTVEYDRFNKSSLIGRPWLIPQEFNAGGVEGVQTLLNESHVIATMLRVFIGFLFGAIPGILIGVIMGLNKTVRNMLDTTLSAFHVLPKIAIFPIMMLIFPDPFGEGPKIAVIAISAFFLVVISTMTGVRDVDEVYLQAGRNYGANRLQMFWHIIMPAALPVIFSGLRLAMATALIVIVAVEFVRAKHGVGFIIFYNWQVLSTEKMYAGLIVVMLLGVFLTYGLQWLEKRIMPWRQQ